MDELKTNVLYFGDNLEIPTLPQGAEDTPEGGRAVIYGLRGC